MEFVTASMLEAVVLLSVVLIVAAGRLFPAIRFCMLAPLAVELMADTELEAMVLLSVLPFVAVELRLTRHPFFV